MIHRLSGRREFAELQRVGVRSGRGPLRRVFRPDPTQSARVAYAIPRSVGSAVDRNRIKRRLRAVIDDLDAEFGVAGGDHLIRITAPLAHWSHDRLRNAMAELLDVQLTSRSMDDRR